MTTGRLPADSKASQLVAGKASDDRSRSLFAEARVYSERLGQELRSLQHSREQVLTIINLIPVALFVKDKNSRLFLVNQVCELQWGVCFSDLRDTDGSQFFPPEQMDQFLSTDRSIFEGRQPVEFEEQYWSTALQSNRVGHTFKRPMYDAEGNPEYLVCVTLDITDRKLVEVALTDSETRLREAITHSPNPMLMHAEDGSILMISAALIEITGYKPEDLRTTKAWAEKAYRVNAPKMLRAMGSLYNLKKVRHEGEFAITTATGKTRIWDFQSQPLPKLPDGRRVVLSLGVDITERRRIEDELGSIANIDALTKMSNRRRFLAHLAEEFTRVQRLGNQSSSILMIDLDLFKKINDTHGQSTGDAVLRHFAHLLGNVMRTIDTAGRLGGEEFAIILPGADLLSARSSAERICEIVAKTPFVKHGKTISLTVSIGVATMKPDDCNGDGTLIRAGDALNRAKLNGRNRVEIAESGDTRHE
jgi:diguanylate cyclase (GGDEF)-like protein/PAS domain S-box-containing protein